ncbi:putative ParB domain protein [Vibrio coralliirubri]|uniref:ParB/RepB/Spo0J family partition protein n=1 Tax=Vibrio coralliirubri TaxID=1516159 RepID=UPI00063A7A49|nr:ParB/RepB/Spo0J family partition protein [Vibrio coralliirubri]CDT52879.1 putative ParB domain protein [Vibrio coralliirubri]
MKHQNELELIYCDPSTLKPNPWNPNQMDILNEDKLDKSIETLGFVRPVIVRELEDGSLEILGGEHRSQSAVRLGIGKIPVTNLGRISDEDAMKVGLVDNGRYGEDNLELLSEVFKEIGSAEEIFGIMPISEEEVKNIFEHDVDIDLDTLGLDDDDVNTLDLDAVSSKAVKTHQIMRFKVSVEDAARIQEFVEKVQHQEGYTESDQLTNAGDALTHIVYSHDDYNEAS